METISVHEAVRRATDPYGPDGLATSARRPPAREVIDRLRADGFEIVPIGSIDAPRFFAHYEPNPPLEGIEQYQVESR